MPNLGHILGPPIVSILEVIWWQTQHAGRGTVVLRFGLVLLCSVIAKSLFT